MTNAVRMADCLSCGDVPWQADGRCSRCGARLLGEIKPDGIDERVPQLLPSPIGQAPVVRTERISEPEPDAAVRSDQKTQEPASQTRWSTETVEDLSDVIVALKAEQEPVRAEIDRLNGLIAAFDIIINHLMTERARRQGKGFRMPEGSWAALHDQCIGCGRTDRRHVGHGYCGTCYQAAKKAGAF